MSAAVQSSIAGIRVVRAFALEESEIARFERTNHDYLDKSLSLARLRGSMGPAMQAISAVGMLVVFWYGGHLLLTGEIRPGGFLAFYRALARLTWPLMALGFLVGMVQRGRASYSRLKEIYDAVPDVSDTAASSDGSVPRWLEVRGLSYGYNGRPVLSNISLSVHQGESLAIVGRTGSGKSTLARLLARLEPTPRGMVFLDGRDICDLPVNSVRSAIGLSQQEAFLFSTTAARNIGYTLDDVQSAEGHQLVVQAARDAQVLDELMLLPDGLETVVGERGVQLSGGQKQRVALGRAFVYRAPFLVLDDPLSAVDARTEKTILEALDRQRAERSLVLITHRIAAAAHCDRVLVLDQGRIVEQGTPEQLARAGTLYQRFAIEQRLASELKHLAEPEREEESA
jgi:ATP-binding cassette subfamily B multidrug efflux pump